MSWSADRPSSTRPTLAARIPALAALLAAVSVVVPPAEARWGSSFSVNTRGVVRDCADIEVDAGRRAVAVEEERFEFPIEPTGEPVRLTAAENGGIVVTPPLAGASSGQIEVRVCKAAAAGDEEQARQRLAEIRVTHSASARELSARGPSSERSSGDWTAFLLVSAPRGAALDFTLRNGPIDLRGAEGSFTIRGENGPVSLRDVAGEVRVDIENGPISLDGGSGSFRLRTDNGPIQIDLAGRSSWEGEGVDARTTNGPLRLELDPDFPSGVVVESTGHSPWDCDAVCSRGERRWDDDSRRIEFGSGPVRVRMRTANGPVAIEAAKP